MSVCSIRYSAAVMTVPHACRKTASVQTSRLFGNWQNENKTKSEGFEGSQVCHLFWKMLLILNQSVVYSSVVEVFFSVRAHGSCKSELVYRDLNSVIIKVFMIVFLVVVLSCPSKMYSLSVLHKSLNKLHDNIKSAEDKHIQKIHWSVIMNYTCNKID